MNERLKQTTLIIAGHGSSKSPNMGRPARLHAQWIKKQNIFADVKTAFWKESPFLPDALKNVTTPNVVIVPNLACSGFINKVVIPREMGLDGILTKRNGQSIHLCQPVGEHPGLATLMAKQLQKLMENEKLSPSETTVFVVAHGNPDPDRPASHDSAVMLATRTYTHCPVQAILPAFLEEKPFLKNWEKRVTTKNVIALPFMIAAGTHGARDIPTFLGITPTAQQEIDLHDNGLPAGPFHPTPNCRIWLMQAIGSHPRMARFIIDIARTKMTEAL
jgi:sirohydrochlorin cobaltochelatase